MQGIRRRGFLAGSLLCACRLPALANLEGGRSLECVTYGFRDGVSDLLAAAEFPGLRNIGLKNEENALAAIAIELSRLLEVNPCFGMFDDAGLCSGNAKADPKRSLIKHPFAITNNPVTHGTVAVGEVLFQRLLLMEHQTAALGAVCAHEYGHILAEKLVRQDLEQLKMADKSIARSELFADFVSGYYAGVRKINQEDYAAGIHALNQFRFGDRLFGEQHHGTPRERAEAVAAGLQLGLRGQRPPAAVGSSALHYVRSLTLETVSETAQCIAD